MCESGKFYGTFVDPVLKSMRAHVAKEIKPNETVIDIACGTGAQVFELSKIVKRITGVDHSESMIKYAKDKARKVNATNVKFILGDATQLDSFQDNSFDTATMTMALHQFNTQLHAPLLSEMKRVAKKIVIVDYAVPLPKNYAGLGSRIIEFFAGIDHNRNFRNYCRVGGLNKILGKNQLTIEKSKLFGKDAFQLVVCSKN